MLGISFAFAILAASSVTPYVWGEPIGISAVKTEIYPRDDIFVTGFVNTDSFYKTVRLTVYDPNGNTLYRPDVNYNNQGVFSWLFHPPIPQFETGTYTIIASHEDVSETAKIQFEVVLKPTEQPTNPLNIVNQKQSTSKEASDNTGNEIPASENIETSGKIQSSSPLSNTIPQEPSESPDLMKTTKTAGGNEFVQSMEFVAIIGTVTAAMIVSIVLWVRSLYLKQTNQKKK